MKIALAQINTTVGDIAGNLEKIAAFSRRAQARGAELAVFPEQALSGYPALDLWEEPAFVKADQDALAKLAKTTGDMGVVVGCLALNPRRAGRPIFNAAALLHRGKVAALRHKSLLPTYDVFDEARYFEPAKDNRPVAYRGRTLGLTICEDAWSRDPDVKRLYAKNPVQSLARAGADILINISASPFERGKSLPRAKLFADHARRAGKPFLYCNLTGGNDEIIFDGQSLALDAKGQTAGLAKAFEEDLLIVDAGARGAAAFTPALGDIEEVASALELGIRDYLRKCGFKKAVVGLSGGIDSAVVCALAARALGPDNVTGVSMPSPYSSRGSRADAQALAEKFAVKFMTLPITGILKSYLETFGEAPGLVEQNLQARIRGNLLMALSNKEGSLLLSTGNKSEMSVGYCTLYGDMSGGLAVLADVPKMTVYALARWINREKELIPQASIDKAPSAELKADQKDQDDLPPYDVLDKILTLYVQDRLSADQITRKGFAPALVKDMLRRIDRAEFKRRQAAPCLRISPKAYGVGRRMPIARGSGR